MKNTLIQNIISNARLMDKQHFLDWFWENKDWMIEYEKKQIEEAFNTGFKDSGLSYKDGEEYYKSKFVTYG